jgi:Protein of Unknown function (DUF2784)
MGWDYLADAVLLIHAAYVGYVVLGLIAILAGVALGWSWVRNFWFRITHLAAIGLVVAESIVGVACPLTVLEFRLRQAAGGPGYGGDCVARWVRPLIFFNLPLWVFTVCYIAFGLAVAAVFYLAPPAPARKKATRVGAQHIGAAGNG